MGAKYLPTIKDLKASQRFQQKQTLPKSPFKKTSGAQAAKKSKGTEDNKAGPAPAAE